MLPCEFSCVFQGIFKNTFFNLNLCEERNFTSPYSHNSRTSHDTDKKLGLVTKFDKRNTASSKNVDDHMSVNCDVIVIFLICFQFAAIRKPDFEDLVRKTFSLIVTLFSNKN